VEKMTQINEILPKDKPRYLMGVGTPVNILEGIERGVDMFDCVMPAVLVRGKDDADMLYCIECLRWKLRLLQ